VFPRILGLPFPPVFPGAEISDLAPSLTRERDQFSMALYIPRRLMPRDNEPSNDVLRLRSPMRKRDWRAIDAIKHPRITVHSELPARLISLSSPFDGWKCCENRAASIGEGTCSLVSRSFQTRGHVTSPSFPIDPVSANCYDRKQHRVRVCTVSCPYIYVYIYIYIYIYIVSAFVCRRSCTAGSVQAGQLLI